MRARKTQGKADSTFRSESIQKDGFHSEELLVQDAIGVFSGGMSNWPQPRIAAQDPTGYKQHPKTKLLASVYKAITRTVPSNPDAPELRLGNTLGSDSTHWRRVKQGMPNRYRLFFRFASTPVKVIVYVWFNDEDTLRKAGAKTDVYQAFKRMLARGVVPAGIQDLQDESSAEES